MVDVSTLPRIDPNAVRQHLASRAEFNRLFPDLYRWIGDATLAKLRDLPGVYYVAGPDDVHVLARRFPQYQPHQVMDWVAFGFPRWELYDVHIGCLCDVSQAPIRFNVGFHALEPVWSRVRGDLGRLEWESVLGHTPHYEFSAMAAEYRWVEPDWLAVDLEDLPGSVQQIAEIASRYVRLVYPLIPRP